MLNIAIHFWAGVVFFWSCVANCSATPVNLFHDVICLLFFQIHSLYIQHLPSSSSLWASWCSFYVPGDLTLGGSFQRVHKSRNRLKLANHLGNHYLFQPWDQVLTYKIFLETGITQIAFSGCSQSRVIKFVSTNHTSQFGLYIELSLAYSLGIDMDACWKVLLNSFAC